MHQLSASKNERGSWGQSQPANQASLPRVLVEEKRSPDKVKINPIQKRVNNTQKYFKIDLFFVINYV